jgi:glycosyltransferase involved in cell wall biosynthesis
MKEITPLSVDIRKIGGGESPLLSVIMIDSRSKKYPEIVERAIASVKQQVFAKYIGAIELIVVNNQDRFHTIGKCRNFGVRKATCDWVFFFDDDDYITPDYFISLWIFMETLDVDKSEIGIISSFSTFIDDEKEEKAAIAKAPMGIYNKAMVLNRKFDETLIKFVDIDFMLRSEADRKKMFICPWHFGYYYYQHADNVSGRKVIGSVK